MKRFILINIGLIFGFGIAMAQLNQMTNRLSSQNGGTKNDSTKTEVESIPPKLYMWRLDESLGTVLRMPVDTANYNFQNSNLTEGMKGHYNYLGNLGSPRMSRIFFERRTASPNIFIEPYSAFIVRPGEFNFTNSNVPYTNLAYYKAGNPQYGEERFKSYFSVNVNKKLAFGFNIDYLYGRGFYNSQSTAFFNAALFGSYMSDHYEASLIYSNNYLKMNENGGITDDRYITDPEAMSNGGKNYESRNIPTNLDASNNRNHDAYLFLTHRYKLGFQRKIKVFTAAELDSIHAPKGQPTAPSDIKKTGKKIQNDNEILNKKTLYKPLNKPVGKPGEKPMGKSNTNRPKGLERDSLVHSSIQPKAKRDSIVYEFVPVTSFIHTMKFEHTFHHFHSADNTKYNNTYIQPSIALVNDTTQYTSIKNTFGIALLEGFNKYVKSGLTAYISQKLSQYKLMDADSTSIDKYSENEVFVGGELSKRQGNTLHYVMNGETGLLGKAIGQFRLNGTIDLNFPLLRDTVSLIARANISNTLPDFYMRHYHSKHYYWDNGLSNEFRSHIEGELSIERLQTHIKVGVENIKDYTYFDAKALPTQNSGNIQIISASLNQNFAVGILHLDNEIIWQKSSNNTVIPLPDLSLYHNLYLQAQLFKKVLNVQLGADVRYFTSYYAPTYTPYIQQFNLQSSSDHVKLGAYPIINVYANFQLKRTRFFAMYYHANEGMGNSMYFLVPHYPINQSLFKIGISWNFYD